MIFQLSAQRSAITLRGNNAEISHRRAADTNLETIGILLLLIVDSPIRIRRREFANNIAHAHVVSLFKLSETSHFFFNFLKIFSRNTVMLCCKEIKWNDSNCDDTTQSIVTAR